MAETPEELYARAKDALRAPPVEEWETWPFQGSVRPRPLEAPAEEPARHGEGGIGCGRCAAGDDEYLWTNDRWRIKALGPTGLPLIAVLPPLPEEIWRENMSAFARGLE